MIGALCLFLLPLTTILGEKSIGYAMTGIVLFLVFFIAMVAVSSRVTAGLVSPMMRHGHLEEAGKILRYASGLNILTGLLFTASAWGGCVLLSYFFSGSDILFLPIASVSPAFVLLGCSGALRGYFRSIGMARPAIYMTRLQTLLSVVFMLVFGKAAHSYGEKVAALLQTPLHTSLYAACGILFGLVMAAFLTLLCYGAVYLLMRRQLKQEKMAGRLPYVRTRGWNGEILRHVLLSLLPAVCITLAGGSVPLLDLKIAGWLSDGEMQEQILGSLGGICGISLAPVLFLTAVLLIPYSGLIKRCGTAYARGNRSAFRGCVQMLVNLSTYTMMPASFFVIGAAPVFSYGMLEETSVAATASVRILAISIVFLGEAVLLTGVCFAAGRKQRPLTSVGIACFIQGVLFYLLYRKTALGLYALCVCISAFSGLWWLLLLLWERDLFRIGSRNMSRIAFTMLSAAIACFPCYFLAEYMVRALGSVLTIFLLLCLYFVIYFPLSIATGAADLKSLCRIPGGAWLGVLGRKMMGRR